MLTIEQKSFFARNGFVRIPGALPADACDALIKVTHGRLPSSWNPAAPRTWVGEVTDSCHTGELAWFKGLLKYQRGDLLSDETIRANFEPGSPMARFAQALLGEPLAPLTIRGLYPILPVADADVEKPRQPHIEGHAAQIVAVTYLADVKPGGAGLLVWPGSHRDIYPAMKSKLDYDATDAYPDIYSAWTAKKPLELTGERGDMFLTHHRLLHAPNVNRSEHIRYAFLCDYKREDFATLCGQPPGPDLWEDWPGLADLSPAERDAPADFVLTPVRPPRKRAVASSSHERATLIKRDSAILDQGRHRGDIWLQLSDDRGITQNPKLLPRGSDLKSTGVQMSVNGQFVESPFAFDLFHCIKNPTGRYQVSVTGVQNTCWLKVLLLCSPYQTSRVVAEWQLEPGAAHSLHFDAPPELQQLAV